jgi:RNA polymerase sigma-70 factor (ECF subfamily)
MATEHHHTRLSAVSRDAADRSADPAGGDPQGHAARIGQIFREHNQSLLRFLTGRLASEQDAREVAQEAYVRLLQLDRPEGVSFLKAFLFKTAANLAIDRVRRRRFADHRGHYLFDLDMESSAESTTSVAEDASVTMAALAELPARQRMAFLLSRLDGLGSTEIAARLGVTDRAVRKYLVRALLHLRNRLQRAHEPPGFTHE